MLVQKVIMGIMACFMVIGVFDKIFLKNRMGYGKEFEAGIWTMGNAFAVYGGNYVPGTCDRQDPSSPYAPLFCRIGADPAIFAGSILAIDMGGYSLASAMTTDQNIVRLSGVLLASMLGATVVFTIPVLLNVCKEADRDFVAKGIVVGVIAIPFGTILGALLAGIPTGVTLVNLIPAIAISILLAAGLAIIPRQMLRRFVFFSSLSTL